MSTTPFSAFLINVRPYCPNVPETVAFNAVANATIEFLRESLWLQADFEGIAVPPYVSEIEMPTAPDVEVAQFLSVAFNNFKLRTSTESELSQIYGLDWRQQTGLPMFYISSNDQVLRLVPTPDNNAVGYLYVTAALKPVRSAVDVDSSVFDRWLEEIACGARARLHEMAGQSFTDFRLAQACAARFRTGIARARAERSASAVGELKVIPRRFY